jgi:predicted secreted protein
VTDDTVWRGNVRNGKLEQLQQALGDQRGRRVVFVSHCILNENVRYLGGAGRQGSVDEVVDGFQAAGVGMCQMPCPEQRAWGGVAKRYLVPAYGSQGTLRYRLRRPLTWVFLWRTRRVYARLARRVARDIADYARSGCEVTGVVGIGASPSCGVFQTLNVGRALEVIADCPVASADAGRFNAALLASARTAGEGLFIRALRRRLARRRLDIPFAEHDLAAELQGAPIPAVEFCPAGIRERGHAR